jgi:hypothetical protein
MFPGGTAGLALILLRVCVLTSLWITLVPKTQMVSGWLYVAVSILCLCLVTGAFTPWVCAIGFVLESLTLWHGPAGPGEASIAVLLALALGLIGPGAFSVDARLFGRRRIIVNRD